MDGRNDTHLIVMKSTISVDHQLKFGYKNLIEHAREAQNNSSQQSKKHSFTLGAPLRDASGPSPPHIYIDW